jgi:hypothetical protein
MLKFFGTGKASNVVFSSYYSKGGMLTLELWSKDTKESKKVKIWGSKCPALKEQISSMMKKFKADELQQYVVIDINNNNNKLEIFCGKGALVFRIGTLKYVEKDVINIASIYSYISNWVFASVLDDMLKLILNSQYKVMEKLGISTEIPKSGTPNGDEVVDDITVGDVKPENLVELVGID